MDPIIAPSAHYQLKPRSVGEEFAIYINVLMAGTLEELHASLANQWPHRTAAPFFEDALESFDPALEPCQNWHKRVEQLFAILNRLPRAVPQQKAYMSPIIAPSAHYQMNPRSVGKEFAIYINVLMAGTLEELHASLAHQWPNRALVPFFEEALTSCDPAPEPCQNWHKRVEQLFDILNRLP